MFIHCPQRKKIKLTSLVYTVPLCFSHIIRPAWVIMACCSRTLFIWPGWLKGWGVFLCLCILFFFSVSCLVYLQLDILGKRWRLSEHQASRGVYDRVNACAWVCAVAVVWETHQTESTNTEATHFKALWQSWHQIQEFWYTTTHTHRDCHRFNILSPGNLLVML